MRSVALQRSGLPILVLWLASNGLGCTHDPGSEGASVPTHGEPFVGAQSECLPDFPDRDGWYGGDAAYSVPLPISNGRVSLWLFGDSFVERPDRPGERSYPFIRNSIGLSLCGVGGDWQFETFWERDETGEPRAFFRPDPEAGWVRRALRETGASPWYWPFDGFVTNDTLFVSLLRVTRSEPRGPFNLPFRLVGTDLARIENFRAPPASWQIRISTLSENDEAFPGSAFARLPRHMGAFAFFDRDEGGAVRMLARIPRRRLLRWHADLSTDLETLARDSNWKPGFRPEDAKILMDDDASEMSVHFDALRKEWIAVYGRPETAHPSPDEEQPGSDRKSRAAGTIWLRRAPDLSGPWSEPEALFVIPELQPGKTEPIDPNLFCYAGKAHPQFSTPHRLVVTYVCSLFARRPAEAGRILRRLREDRGLYRARAVSVPFPPRAE